MKRWVAAGLVLAAVAGAVAVAVNRSGHDGELAKQAKAGAPNVIVIMTDDQSLNTWRRRYMPKTFARIVDPGTDFSEGFAVPPLCCPARATLMTGRYPHNHEVLTNNYSKLADKEDVLPVWLRDAGYRTMLAGKFLNGYNNRAKSDEGARPAPGWDRWWVEAGEERNFFNYEVSIDGEVQTAGDTAKDYITNALTAASVEFMREESDEPYFLWMSHVAPHAAPQGDESDPCYFYAPVPLARDFKRARGMKLPTNPSYFEDDVSDKPPFIQKIAPDGSGEAEFVQDRIKRTFECTVASLYAVDRSIERVFETLEETGQIDNTAVFFISDNGIFFGEHRKAGGKKLAYDPSSHIPFAMVLPKDAGRAAPSESDAVTGTVDIAPTILDLAGLEGEHRVDGRSLLDLPELRGDWPRHRALPLEIGEEETKCKAYRALRSAAYLYVEYLRLAPEGGCRVGMKELYDMEADPYQLRNLLGVSPVLPADRVLADGLSERLSGLEECSGVEGRDPADAEPFCE